MLVFCFSQAFAQADSSTVLTFDFNDHTYNELQHRVTTQPVGVTLVEDRFGNERSALYLQGHANSYFILESSDELKPAQGSISLWVKLERIVFAGKGYESNPVMVARNSSNVDFYDAFSFFYDFKSDRMMVFFTKDSTEQTGLNSIDNIAFNSWYHFVFTWDDHKAAFYINGKKQGEAKKNFRTVYLQDSPIYIGQGGSTKNDRRTRGAVDDIKIFHRVLGEKEIADLYNAPNPNKARLILTAVLKYICIAVLIFIAARLMVWQRRRALQRTQEKLELKKRLHEMEIRTLKAQMNPHFIFNSLNSIQQLIMQKDNEKAEIYLTKFSKLLRKLLESNANESLTVQEEIEILEHYTGMEAMRFNHTFTFRIEAGPDVDLSTRIPHLMIQPFVENAIWHGLLAKKGSRHLLVRFGKQENGTITCIVDDDGIGREASRKKEDTFKKRSLALSFVSQRLELMKETMKVSCRVEIVDKKDKEGNSTGTRVIIVLPVISKTQHVTGSYH